MGRGVKKGRRGGLLVHMIMVIMVKVAKIVAPFLSNKDVWGCGYNLSAITFAFVSLSWEL